eukprot:3374201-Lingulodinium_polyedra.AAC.1
MTALADFVWHEPLTALADFVWRTGLPVRHCIGLQIDSETLTLTVKRSQGSAETLEKEIGSCKLPVTRTDGQRNTHLS